VECFAHKILARKTKGVKAKLSGQILIDCRDFLPNLLSWKSIRMAGSEQG
jgi:hypothetical protein